MKRGTKQIRGQQGLLRRGPALIAHIGPIALALSVLLVGCGAEGGPAGPPASNIGRVVATLPTPTVTPTVEPDAAHNAALGCNPQAPQARQDIVFLWGKQGVKTPVPREVALTFDDGPTPYTSPPILSYLEQTHTPATFFVEGQYVHLWPYLLQREWRDGFAVAVHTWDHPEMTKVTVEQMRHQFGDTLAAIHSIIGQNACVWLWRPPYGSYNQQVLQMAVQYGLTTVTWDDSSADWTRPGVQQIANNVLGAIHPGAIVLMHDGPALRDETAAALPIILAGLRARGYTPVTLPKLLADGGYPGVSVGPAAT